MLIYCLSQVPGFLNRLNYRKSLCKLISEAYNLDDYILYVKYDQNLEETDLINLTSEGRENDFGTWLKILFELWGDHAIEYKGALCSYLRR